MRILVSLLALALALLPGPAWAQSILRDAETEAFFREISRPLIDAAGLDPRSGRGFDLGGEAATQQAEGRDAEGGENQS